MTKSEYALGAVFFLTMTFMFPKDPLPVVALVVLNWLCVQAHVCRVWRVHWRGNDLRG